MNDYGDCLNYSNFTFTKWPTFFFCWSKWVIQYMSWQIQSNCHILMIDDQFTTNCILVLWGKFNLFRFQRHWNTTNNLSIWWLRQKQLNITCRNCWLIFAYNMVLVYSNFISAETRLITSPFDDSNYCIWILHVVIDDQGPVH